MSPDYFFITRKKCPFCDQSNHPVINQVKYHDTAEANKKLPNITGKLYHCTDCGIAYPSHMYKIEFFEEFYKKSFKDLKFFDESFFQKIRKKYIKEIMRNFHNQSSLSRVLDLISLSVFQVPYLTQKPQDLNLCDVGCGFGEFLSIYQELGNNVVGTEIHPSLVQRLATIGLPIKEGEIEDINFGDTKFDAVIFRAVFYRTRQPSKTLNLVTQLLATNGEIALIDPCPGLDGVEYFFKKQFPQGQFYILERNKYISMLEKKFTLKCHYQKLIYGRPNASLKPIKLIGNIIGFGELLAANLLKQKPYVLSYTLKINKSNYEQKVGFP